MIDKKPVFVNLFSSTGAHHFVRLDKITSIRFECYAPDRIHIDVDGGATCTIIRGRQYDELMELLTVLDMGVPPAPDYC